VAATQIWGKGGDSKGRTNFRWIHEALWERKGTFLGAKRKRGVDMYYGHEGQTEGGGGGTM